MIRILIVDDDDLFREFLAELVSNEGFTPVASNSGEAAVSTLRSLVEKSKSAEYPDLILVDYNMKQMNGFEFIRAVRMMPPLARLPIMMMTGTTKNIQGAVEMEGVKYLPKGSSTRDILKNLRAFVPVERALAAKKAGVAAAKAQAAPAAAAPAGPPPPMRVERIASFTTESEKSSKAKDDDEQSDDKLQRLMALSRKIADTIEPHSEKVKADEKLKAEDAARDASQIINLVDGILAEAIRHRASDIHLDPQQNGLHVRFRIDGILHSKVKLPNELADNIVSRLKIMSDLNVTERRLPQDGRFTLRPENSPQVEFRLSTLPAHKGEKIVIRLLKADNVRARLSDIFLSPKDLAHVETALASPNGMILVTGPTGSGKTTTLYTMLDVLNLPTRNIITIEDPIEGEVQGVTQVPVQAKIGYTFEKVIRACLRQDPNIIMVGEIRDQETAEIAMKAAMTGHLLLATLHANTAPLAVYRLMTMGVKPFLIVSSIELIVAQRLLRLLCPHCKTPVKPSQSPLARLAEKDRGKLSLIYEPKGCDQCNGIGYKGRQVVTEVMPFKSHLIRQLAYQCSNPDLIQAQAQAEGMITISEAALKLAAEGATSLSEALTLYSPD